MVFSAFSVLKSYTSNALIDMVEILFSREEVLLKMCLIRKNAVT